MIELFLLVGLAAQPVDQGDVVPTLELPPVIVVATRSQRPLSDVVGSVTVIDDQRIADQLVRNPSDLVRLETDISVPRTGTRFGFGSYSIRGIGGNRVAIEIDGIPAPDEFHIGSFSDSGRDLVDFSLIHRVEVLRGPASTLYGSDALGGVISFSTLNAEDLEAPLGLEVSHHSADSTDSASMIAGHDGQVLDLVASVTHRGGRELESGAGVTEDDLKYDTTSEFVKATADLSNFGKITLIADAFKRESTSDIHSVLGDGRFRSTTLLTGDDAQARRRFSVRYEALPQAPWLDSASATAFAQSASTNQETVEERANANLRRWRLFNFDQDVHGLRSHVSGSANAGSMFHALGIGVDLRRVTTKEVRDGLQTDLDGSNPSTSILGESFPVRDFPNSTTDEIGLYAHDEITVSNRWTAIAALRYDNYRLKPRKDPVYVEDHPSQDVVELHEDAWSPKVGVLFRASADSTAYLQYVRGFRAPPFEDANIGLDIPLFNIRALPNPDLRSETSDGLEVGWRMDKGSTRWSVSGYYTRFDDFIETKARIGTDPETGTLLFQSRNIDTAEIYGTQIEFEHAFAPNAILGEWIGDTSIRIGAHANKGEDRDSGNGLNSVDPARLVTSLRWNPATMPLSVEIHATATGSKRDASGENLYVPGGFTVFDLTARWQMTDRAVLRLGAFNLSDKTYWRWSDIAGLGPGDPIINQLAAPGRNAAVSFSYHW